jgi:hypothetical protein
MVCTDITSVFRLVQSKDVTSAYDLIYDSSLNPCYDATFQAYANYVDTQIPNMDHIWMGYRLDRVMPGAGPVGQIGWFAVKYTVPGTAGFPGTSVLQPPLLVDQTYEITRGVFYKNAQDQDLPHFGDPSCKLPSFKIRIAVATAKAGAPRAAAGRAIATISVDGRPDRQIAIEAAPPRDRDPRLQLEPASATPPRPSRPTETGKPPAGKP